MDKTVIASILGGSVGAAIVTGLLQFVQFLIKRKDQKNGGENTQNKALRYLMLYIIQERCKYHLHMQEISLEDRRAIHHWHDVYHNGLGGNGDADAMMRQVDHLPIKLEEME